MSRFRIYDLRFKNWIFVPILTTCFLLPTSILLAADPRALAREIEQVKHDRETLLVEQARLVAELEKVNTQSESLGTAVKSLDTTRKKLAADIKVTQSKINSTNLNIRSLENNMADKERAIDTHEAAIGLALKALHEYDSRSLILDVLSSTKLSDFWQDRGELGELSTSLNKEVNNLRETKDLLNEEKKKKEEDKERILNLQAELNGQKSVVEESKKAQEKLLVETKNREAAYQQMLSENLARQKQFEEDLYRLESELNITLDPSLIPARRAGVLSWPLDKVFITGYFGTVSGNRRVYASGFHNGVDFRAAMGTPVRAMLTGVVEGHGNTDEQRGCYSYGRWILIKHKNGLSSIYAHLSATLMQNGQNVKQGDVIGYSGGQKGVFGSGYSTGPHLHVGLFASQGVSIRQFVTSRGCQLVFVPIADVKAYLDPLAYLPSI
ncbi:MAG: peptidoglycan DD-metalloendopeptidase family protein [Patescibacteria group bacterium]